MPRGKTHRRIGRRLEELRKKQGGILNIEEIADIIEAAISQAKAETAAKDNEFLKELKVLSSVIRDAKADIADLKPGDVKTELIPTATGELDAIVEATENATHEIMDATEQIELLADKLDGELAENLRDAATRIYLACGFQDITGQRTTKVVSALKEIEEKVDVLLAAFGEKSTKRPAKKAKQQKKRTTKNGAGKKAAAKKPLSDEDLLEGPQLPDQANRQEEIDALLASFD